MGVIIQCVSLRLYVNVGALCFKLWTNGIRWIRNPPALGVAHRLSCPVACGISVPLPGIEPASPAFRGRFLTTGPPGKSSPLNFLGFSGGSVGKESACNAGEYLQHKRREFDPWVRKIPWRRKWLPTPDSCLGNPMERGAWGSLVHGAARTRQDWVTKPPPPALEPGSLPFPSKISGESRL